MNAALSQDRLEALPGWEMVAEGLADAAAGRTTPFACTVWMALPRLQRAGLIDEALLVRRMAEPELTLYRLLCREPGNGYGRYNGILRRLVRFEHALDRTVPVPIMEQ